VGINEEFTILCDWCGVQPETGQTFNNYMEAYQEMVRVSQYEGWLLRTKDGQIIFACPECVADGRVRG
jgi:hypothetical protein